MHKDIKFISIASLKRYSLASLTFINVDSRYSLLNISDSLIGVVGKIEYSARHENYVDFAISNSTNLLYKTSLLKREDMQAIGINYNEDEFKRFKQHLINSYNDTIKEYMFHLINIYNSAN